MFRNNGCLIKDLTGKIQFCSEIIGSLKFFPSNPLNEWKWGLLVTGCIESQMLVK